MTDTKTTQNDTSTRIIDLSQNGAEIFENSSMILQKEALEQLHDLIGKQLAKIEEIKADKTCSPSFGTELSYPRIHQAILIEGGRGSGKTTFLLNALSALHTPPNEAVEEHKKISRKLHVLPIIDPTLIETKERIILIIISLIESTINKKSYECNINDDLSESLKKARENMAGGLNLLDGIGSAQPYGESWEDEAWVMSVGLSKAEKSRFFERKFNAYLEAALNILGKKAFVLAFDDVDTNFKIGFSVLEAIRKYLSSPQLVLIISGDIDLYGRLVRKNIYKVFGKKVLSHDPDLQSLTEENKPSEMPKAIRELEEQYILKIIPPQNRIAMLSLAGILQTPSEKIIIKNEKRQNSSEKSEEISIEEWASKHIKNLLALPENSSHAKDFFNVLSQEPLRLVISYLRALDKENAPLKHFEIFTVFSTRLKLNGIDAFDLSQSDFYKTLKITFQWLVSQENPEALIRFNISSNIEKNTILHCLAIAITSHLKKFSNKIMDCIFILNLPIVMMQHNFYGNKNIQKTISDFLWNDFSWNTQEPSLLMVVGRLGAIARYAANNTIGNLPASCFGFVNVKNRENSKETLIQQLFYLKQTKDISSPLQVHDLYALLDEQREKSNVRDGKIWLNIIKNKNKKLSEKNAIGNNIWKGLIYFSIDDIISSCGPLRLILDLISYNITNSRGALSKSISSLSLFAVITSLLNKKSFPKARTILSPTHFVDDIPYRDIASFLDKENIKTTIPNFNSRKIDNQFSYSENDDPYIRRRPKPSKENEDQQDFEKFMYNINVWHNLYIKLKEEFENKSYTKFNFDLSIISSIAEKLNSGFLSFDQQISSKWLTGEILHRQITIILYSIISTTSDVPQFIGSPKESDNSLINILERTINPKFDTTKLHPLGAIILACPLLWIFLVPNDENNLREKAKEAFFIFLKNETSLSFEKDEKLKKYYENFFTPPKINFSIGQGSDNLSSVETDGFFDILNVVPRYQPSR